MRRMEETWLAAIISVAGVLLHAFMVGVALLAERRHPTATMAWVLGIIFLPGVGVVLYALFGASRARRVASRAGGCAERVAAAQRQTREGHGLPATTEPRTDGFLRLTGRLSSTRASDGNDVGLLVNAAAAYRSMIAAMEAAEHQIHVQFYIIQPDATGEALRDRLARRAAEGLEVRVLCDGLGSGRLPADFWDPLTSAGGRVAYFHPMRRMVRGVLNVFGRRDRVDFRNHRKIVVVDGKVGFTGGINVGKEYLGLDPDMGSWRDTHLRLEGPAVAGLQATFLKDWLVASDELVEEPSCFSNWGTRSGALVQIVDSGPDSPWSSITHAFMHAYAHARSRIWITSPYFIPSPEIFATLESAALRGVDVRLLLPAHADHLLVHLAARSYYKRLIDAGIRVFHYESAGFRWSRDKTRKGFVHAKTLVVDSWLATVGSANMDMRSFHLNFELNAFVFEEAFVDRLADQYRSDLADALEVTADEIRAWTLTRRLAYQGARLLSPLL